MVGQPNQSNRDGLDATYDQSLVADCTGFAVIGKNLWKPIWRIRKVTTTFSHPTSEKR